MQCHSHRMLSWHAYDCTLNRRNFDNVHASFTHIYKHFRLHWGLTVQSIGIKGATCMPIIYDTTKFFSFGQVVHAI